MRVLGIDPGLRLTGYACIEGDGLRPAIVEAGVFRLARARRLTSTPPTSPTSPTDVARAVVTGMVAPGAAMPGRATGAAPPVPPAALEPKPAADAASVSDRLAELDRDFRAVLERLRPQAVAVEALFAHYKHPATAIVMGHARGVILLAIRQHNLPLLEFRPKLVKKGVTGSGAAGKAQVQRAVQMHFNLPAPPSPPDVADALAIALCAARRLWTERAAQPSGPGPLSRG